LGGAERQENTTVWCFQRGVSGYDIIGKPPNDPDGSTSGIAA